MQKANAPFFVERAERLLERIFYWRAERIANYLR